LGIKFRYWNGTIIKPHSGNETIFSFFTADDSYFPTEQQEMLNFQVYNLNETIKGIPVELHPRELRFSIGVWHSCGVVGVDEFLC
jgi:xylose isomerase